MPRIVLFDADVISHFLVSEKLSFLPAICNPHKMMILEAVYLESIIRGDRKDIIDHFMKVNNIVISLFPSDNIDMNREFALIKRNTPLIGDGERACMSHAKFNSDVIASSNFSNVASYCVRNHIDYLGTLDLLAIALKKGILNPIECDNFITEVKAKNRARFPTGVIKISDYNCTKLSLLD